MQPAEEMLNISISVACVKLQEEGTFFSIKRTRGYIVNQRMNQREDQTEVNEQKLLAT